MDMFDEFDPENFNWDDAMKLKESGLYYEAHCKGIDGENFIFSIYLENNNADSKIAEIAEAFGEIPSFSEGYVYCDISKASDNMVSAYIDMGNAKDDPIPDALKALNKVKGIKKLIINEELEDMF